MSAEDADTHRKAQRFARLLVDEIKLYNQAKVAEGRRNKDLYDRLKEDIEKSRSTFQKRYGTTAAASGDYFQKEVVRSLAEDDTSVMGAISISNVLAVNGGRLSQYRHFRQSVLAFASPRENIKVVRLGLKLLLDARVWACCAGS